MDYMVITSLIVYVPKQENVIEFKSVTHINQSIQIDDGIIGVIGNDTKANKDNSIIKLNEVTGTAYTVNNTYMIRMYHNDIYLIR